MDHQTTDQKINIIFRVKPSGGMSPRLLGDALRAHLEDADLDVEGIVYVLDVQSFYGGIVYVSMATEDGRIIFGNLSKLQLLNVTDHVWMEATFREFVISVGLDGRKELPTIGTADDLVFGYTAVGSGVHPWGGVISREEDNEESSTSGGHDEEE